MHTEDNNSNRRDHIVRMMVEGSRSAVNTIEEQKTARGLSLLCPFPALEVSVPVRLSNPDGSEFRGCIHRIGVEDDPETGLPKLRLSVRAQEEEVRTVPAEMDGDTSKSTDCMLVSEKDIVLEMPTEPVCNSSALLQGLLGDLVDRNTAELLSLEDLGHMDGGEGRRDPDWASEGPIYVSDDPAFRSRTRRKRAVGVVAAWAVVAGIAVGGAWVLHRAGVVDLSGFPGMAGTAGPGIAMSTEADASLDALKQFQEPVFPTAVVDTTEVSRDVSARAISLQEEIDVPVAGKSMTADEMKNEKNAANSEDGMIEVVMEQIAETEILLPTRWPAEYSSSYRLRDPNGVVVDVPGALVKREGWLSIPEDEQIVRSVRVLQRENGARFIVYVHGELPNFRTRAQTEGIRLNLYYDDDETVSETQEIAMVNR